VLVRQVENRVGVSCALLEGVKVVEVPSERVSALRLEGGGRRIVPCEADHGMSSTEQFINGSRTDPAGGSGHEYMHLFHLSMSLSDITIAPDVRL
jgi:hypothetical protein